MLLSWTGVITLWTDILTLRPELNSGPTKQRTYGSRPRQDGGQGGPDSWLRQKPWELTATPGHVAEGRGLPEQLGSYGGADWQGWDEWQAGGLDGRELSVVEGGESRSEGVT